MITESTRPKTEWCLYGRLEKVSITTITFSRKIMPQESLVGTLIQPVFSWTLQPSLDKSMIEKPFPRM